MRILLAIDGSSYSTKAAEFVAGRDDLMGKESEIHLLNVQLPVATQKARRILGDEAVDGYYQQEAMAALETAEKIFEARNIPCQTTYLVGQIAQEIANYVRDKKIDMIVMGSQGQGAMEKLIMGSVVSRVLAITTTPVLVIR